MHCTEPAINVGLIPNPLGACRSPGLNDLWWTSHRPDQPEIFAASLNPSAESIGKLKRLGLCPKHRKSKSGISTEGDFPSTAHQTPPHASKSPIGLQKDLPLPSVSSLSPSGTKFVEAMPSPWLNYQDFRKCQLQRMEAIGLLPDSWPNALLEQDR